MKMNARHITQASLVVICALSAVLFENCGIQRPGVENRSFASVSFNHSGKETSCSTCHNMGRPTSTAGFLGLNLNAPFDYTTHGAGLDCITCHMASTTKSDRSRADWAGGKFDHPATLSSCVDCHSEQRPKTIVNGFDHSVAGAGDCWNCHQNSLRTSFTSMNDWQGGENAPAALVYDVDRDLTVVGKIPTYSTTGTATSISRVTPLSQTFHMAMNHASKQFSASTMQNCTMCHMDGSLGIYTNGVFHKSLTAMNMAQPTTCNECHTGASPKGFVGPDDAKRNPLSAAMKHDAVVWSNGKATISSLVINDCAVCHKSPPTATAGWSQGVYHTALQTANLTQPSSCLDCHANSRPTGLQPANAMANTTAYDHMNGGMGDCVSCHTNTTTWSSGVFHASAGAQTTCLTCHSSARPTSASGFLGYDSVNKPFDVATHGGSLDCVTCHAATKQFLSKANWSGGNYVHKAPLNTCFNCHSSQKPTTLAQGGGFDHTGVGDCAGCHQASLSSTFSSMANWSGGINGTPTGPVAAKNISVPSVRLVFTGTKVTSTTNVTQTLPVQFLHSSTQIPAALNTACLNCHTTSASGAMINGIFHAKMTAAQNAAIVSCKDCHAGTMPQDIVGDVPGVAPVKPMDHDAMLTGGGTAATNFDCAVCHKDRGGSFSNGGFHANLGAKSPANCTTCHYVVMPQSLTASKKMLHTSNYAAQDCATCHILPTAAQIATPAATNWNSSAAYHSKVAAPASCTDCHTNQRPGVTVSALDAQHMNHASAAVAVDCASCHAGDLNLNPRAWSKSIALHSLVPTPATCTTCHGLGNGSTVAGTGNDLPPGLTTTAMKTTSSVAPVNTFDQITHTDASVAGKDCKVCHTVVGMTGAKWKSAKFHANTPTITGKCVNCHNNIKPTVTVGGFSHATIGTMDCASCHNFPGKGTTTAPNWLGAVGGVPATITLTPPTGSTRPPLTIAHPVLGTNVTCASCHGGTAYTPVFGFDHNLMPTGTACVYCHQTGQTTVTKTGMATGARFSTKSQGHENANLNTQDCNACHKAGIYRLPTKSATAPATWTGGSWGSP